MKRAKSSATMSLTLNSHLVQDNIPVEVVPKVYIGSIHAAFNQEAIIERGITHIVNASGLPATFPRTFTYLSIELRDKEATNILACVPAANIFIEAGLGEGAVLVHCAGGRSRSAALVTAFLMTSRGWSFDHALSVVKAARSVIQVNKGFEQQLRAYGAQKCDVYAAHQVVMRQRLRDLVDRRLALVLDQGRPVGREHPAMSSPKRRMSGGQVLLQIPCEQVRVIAAASVTDFDLDTAVDPTRYCNGMPLQDGHAQAPSKRTPSMSQGGSTPHTTWVADASQSQGSQRVITPTPGMGGAPASGEGGGLGVGGCMGCDVQQAQPQSARRGSQDITDLPRSVNRSLHRQGRTGGTGQAQAQVTTALPPISALDPPQGPMSPASCGTGTSKLVHAFDDGGTGDAGIPPSLRGPYYSMGQMHVGEPATSGPPRTPKGASSRRPFQQKVVRIDTSTYTEDGEATPSSGEPGSARRPSQLQGIAHADASSLLNARNRYQSAPALPRMNAGVKPAKKELHPQQPPTPHLRLSRPTTSAVQTIPALEGLQRKFFCLACNTKLFSLANVVRLDFVQASSLIPDDLEGAVIVNDVDVDDEDEASAANGRRTTPKQTVVHSSGSAGRSGRGLVFPGQVPPLSLLHGDHVATTVALPSAPTTTHDGSEVRRSSLTLDGSGGGSSTRRPSSSGSSAKRVTSPSAYVSLSGRPLSAGLRQVRLDIVGANAAMSSPRLGSGRRPSGIPASLSNHPEGAVSPLAGVSSPLAASRSPALREMPVQANTPKGSPDARSHKRDQTLSSCSSPQTPHSCVTSELSVPPSPPCLGVASPACSSPCVDPATMFRPASAERRRWLRKMRALEDARGNGTESGELTCKTMENDVDACAHVTLYKGRWIPIEYMPWMGDLVSADQGTILCPNTHCAAEIGRFDWSETLFGSDLSMAVELPLMGVEMTKVVAASSPSLSRGSLSRLNSVDSTCSENTPRDNAVQPMDGVTEALMGTQATGTPKAGVEWSHGVIAAPTPKSGRGSQGLNAGYMSLRRSSGSTNSTAFHFLSGGAEAAPVSS